MTLTDQSLPTTTRTVTPCAGEPCAGEPCPPDPTIDPTGDLSTAGPEAAGGPVDEVATAGEVGTRNHRTPWASVTACPNGPLLVRGDVEILLASGEPAPRRRATVALCRCGASGIKPFCDGSHKAIGFRTEDEPT